MRKSLQLCLMSILSIFLLLPDASTQEVTKLWNGLAEILERNMDSPDNAVSETKSFIRDNRGEFQEWRDSVRKNIEKAKMRSYQELSQEEMENIGAAMQKRPGAEALSRWTTAVINFSTKNPEQTTQINELMESYSPKFDDY